MTSSMRRSSIEAHGRVEGVSRSAAVALRHAAAGLATAALVVGLVANPGEAQTAKYGAGFVVGATHIGELNSGALALGGGSPVELKPGTGFILGVHFDSWYGESRRIGIRWQGSYQQPEVDWANGQRDIDTLAADLSLLIRPVTPDRDEPVIPYLALGLGGIWYDLGRGPQTVFDPADAYYDGSSRVMPAGLVGLGVDILLPPSMQWHASPIRLRLEAADHITLNSPFKQLSQAERYGAVHHFRLTIGAYSAFSIFGD